MSHRKVLAFFLAVTCVAVSAHGSLVQEIAEKLNGLAAADDGFQVELARDGESENSAFKVFVIGPVLIQETTTLSDAHYPRTVRCFSTNGYKNFREGGVVGGQRVRSEAELYATEEPVTGTALFASRFHQARLLLMLRESVVSESECQGEITYEVSGKVKQTGILLNIKLSFAQKDCVLLEHGLSIGSRPQKSIKLVATRSTTSGGDGLYSKLASESWVENKIASRSDSAISLKRTLLTPDAKPKEFIIPRATLVTDSRFGHGVVYEFGVDRLTDVEIAKMAEDFDYRTNRYYLSRFKLDPKGAQPTMAHARLVVVSALFLVGLLPILGLVWFRKSKASNL